MILEGDAMTFYSEHLAGEINFEKIVAALNAEFTSEEQRNRLLRVWQRTSLVENMRNRPEKSEVMVFKNMCRTLSTTQRQLHKSYYHDNFLRDQILVATDVEELDRSLREKIPKNSHEAIQRIANLMSNTPGSAGKRKGVDDRAFYGIGSKFGGDARRRKRFPTRKKPPHMTKSQNDEKVGCIVCKRDHLARNHHSREAIISAVRKKRSSERRSLVAECVSLDHKEEERDSENSNNDAEPDQGLIEDSDSEDESDSSAFHAAVVDVNRASEVSLSNVKFSHGLCSKSFSEQNAEMNAAFREAKEEQFDGVIMDTACNRSSMISLSHYNV